MNHIRRAAYFNNSGATFLATGENGKAFKALRISLKCLAQAILQSGDDTSPMTESHSDPLMSEMICRAIPRSSMNPTNESSREDDGKPFLYSKGLVFYPNSTITVVDLAFYGSVVVFNLVISYHRRSKNLQESELQKLLLLYELCFKLIGEGSRSNQYDCCNIMVAVLNNSSVVHSELGQHARARRTLYPVWDVMKYPERRPGQLETWEVEGIFLNLYLMLVNFPQVAEAA